MNITEGFMQYASIMNAAMQQQRLLASRLAGQRGYEERNIRRTCLSKSFRRARSTTYGYRPESDVILARRRRQIAKGMIQVS